MSQHQPDPSSSSLKSRVLVVDLDGTLIQTDLLLESFLAFFKHYPLETPRLLWVFLWGGRLRLKEFLANRLSLSPKSLPYNREVIRFIEEQKALGLKSIVLASASFSSLVKSVADEVGCFDSWHGSSSDKNLKGEEKLHLLQDFYGSNLDYIGNEKADLPIWRALGKAYVANPSLGLLKTLQIEQIPAEVISQRKAPLIKIIFRALRPYQWTKNVLVLLPFLAAHRFGDITLWTKALIATLAFSLTASGVYILNDLMDLEADRLHLQKCRRPFASGDLSIWWGFFLLPLLIGLVMGLASLLPFEFTITLLLYFFSNLLYSLGLKRIHSLDLILLAGMYTIRLIAGGAATGISFTPWFALFFIFFFFGLACVKRLAEITKASRKKIEGRGYLQEDKSVILALGVGTSLISPLILALYMTSPQVVTLYQHPNRLWILLPLLLFWISHIWIAAGRGEVPHDPILYAFKDKVSYLVGGISLLCIWMSI